VIDGLCAGSEGLLVWRLLERAGELRAHASAL
jgi:hypothetical protein